MHTYWEDWGHIKIKHTDKVTMGCYLYVKIHYIIYSPWNLLCMGRMIEYELWRSTFSQVSTMSKELEVDGNVNESSLFSTDTPFSLEVPESTADVTMLDAFCLASNGSFKLNISSAPPSPMSWSLLQARVFECAVMQAHDTFFPGHIVGVSHVIDVLPSNINTWRIHDYNTLMAQVCIVKI